ncbi:hypothetical protein [Streptomyces sp. NPDC049887]|uniref:hypothetical protein n=1 Tax=Streptomyces sp. NPDC049887 TaxID=3155654 RepID=UPI003435EE64
MQKGIPTMARSRCQRFKSIAARWDKEIAAQAERASNVEHEDRRGLAEAHTRAARRAKVRALETHLRQCRMCY